MNTYKLTVATPDGNRFEGEVIGLFLRGAEGDLAVLAGHLPFITSVTAGKCRIRLKGEEEWKTYEGGQSFNVPGNSSFDIRVAEAYHYICHFG